mgnify:CR=1 FL=1|jgi:group I intron endonuclease
MGFIYKLTNRVTGNMYIGLTTRTPIERFKEHWEHRTTERCKDYPLYKALRKYGKRGFALETLEEVPDDQLEKREIYWIALYDTYKGKGYNITPGGLRGPSQQGAKRSQATRKKISLAKKGVKLGPPPKERREKISKALKGKPKTKAHKEALSKAWETRSPFTEETIEKKRKSMLGKNSKVYVLVSPLGEIVQTSEGLNAFLREHPELSSAMLRRLVGGKIDEYKGWTVYKEDNKSHGYN